MTIAMLALAGFPATAGFFGKIYLIDAAVDNGYAWLGVVIVLGSAISLAYYLRVVAAVWMRSPSEALAAAAATPGGRPAIAGGSRRGRRAAATAGQLEVLFVAVAVRAATWSSGSIPIRCWTSPATRAPRARSLGCSGRRRRRNCGWVGRRTAPSASWRLLHARGTCTSRDGGRSRLP